MVFVSEGRMQLSKVADVVSHQGPTFLDRCLQLFLICQAQVMGAGGAQGIVSAVTKDFGQKWAHILVQVESY